MFSNVSELENWTSNTQMYRPTGSQTSLSCWLFFDSFRRRLTSSRRTSTAASQTRRPSSDRLLQGQRDVLSRRHIGDDWWKAVPGLECYLPSLSQEDTGELPKRVSLASEGDGC